ncbi:hypothetical protein J6V86_01550 [bacterium]|nr:hypothetical protein [bacterium]
MMHSVNDDSLDDSDDDNEVLISEILEDLVGSVIEKVWILILGICYEEYFEVDFDDEEQKYVSERI